MPRPGQRSVGFSLRRGDADFRLLRQAGEDWLAEGAEPLLPLAALALPGRHNAANALAALAVGSVARLPARGDGRRAASFRGLPHRAERVRDRRGVAWIDDSKGTNVGATVAAIEGLDGPLVLIAGGEGKGQDFAPLGAGLPGQGEAGDPDRPRRAAARRRARGPLPGVLRGIDGGGGRRRGRRSRARATPCCCRRPARASTCSATTRTAATLSPRPCGSCRHEHRRRLQYSRSAGRQQRLALDPVILVTVFGLLLVGLVMVSSASLNVAERLTGDPVLPLRAPVLLGAARLHLRRRDAGRADRDLEAARAVAAGRELRAAGPGADPGHRPRGQRQLALDPHRAAQFPAVRARALVPRHLHRDLRRAPPDRAAQLRAGLLQAARGAGRGRGAAARRAGLRRRGRALRHRHRRAVRGRRAAARLPASSAAAARRRSRCSR